MRLLIYQLTIAAFLISSSSAYSQETAMPEMKTYTFVMLTKGTNRTHPKEEVQKIQAGHMAHLTMMAEKHGLNIAGPFLDDGFWRGILIFDNSDTTFIRSLVEQDPAVKSGRLDFELHPWMSQKGASLK